MSGAIENHALHSQAVTILRNALENEKQFVKVHAAETILSNEHVIGTPLSRELRRRVIEAFIKELRFAEGNYKIVVWRVLARAADNFRECANYIDKILDAFLDTCGKSRMHAIEALAKLGYSEQPAELMRVSKMDSDPLQAYARWVLANSGNPSDEASFSELLNSKTDGARLRVAYGLRFLNRLQASTLAKLEAVLEIEARDALGRVYLLNALFVHSSFDKYQQYRPALLKFLTEGNTGQKSEVCAAFGVRGGLIDIPIVHQLLHNSDGDVRIFAAGALLGIFARYSSVHRLISNKEL